MAEWATVAVSMEIGEYSMKLLEYSPGEEPFDVERFLQIFIMSHGLNKEMDFLTPKGPMVFLEFWLGSYKMSLKPIFFIFLELVLFFEIYLSM